MQLKAEAWKQYGEAAVIQQVLETLPAVAEAVAQPLARTDRIVMFGGGDSGTAPANSRAISPAPSLRCQR